MTKPKYLILDVRTKEEYELEHLDEALNIPLSIIQEGQNPPCSFDTKIFVHCASGARSKKAKNILENRGFKYVENTYNIDQTKARLL